MAAQSDSDKQSEPQLDLSLPELAPELVQRFPESGAFPAFAIYTLVPGMAHDRLQAIADVCLRPWKAVNAKLHQEGDVPAPIVKLGRPADAQPYHFETLKDVIAAHAALNKERQPGDPLYKPDLDYFDMAFIDIAFLVVTKDDIDDHHALLFVYVDTEPKKEGEDEDGNEEKEEAKEDDDYSDDSDYEPEYDLSGKLDKFYLEARYADFFLSDVIQGTLGIREARETSNVDVDRPDYDSQYNVGRLEGRMAV